jgi:hypothetical protein
LRNADQISSRRWGEEKERRLKDLILAKLEVVGRSFGGKLLG